ncbi:MAG TPA: SUMF1/EgtB/PvdO family nonheme iron enzyme [Armatimonadota bacterium]|nr:SUMF1/EgtB/PvdO family nonheme iron enzyme [Armatimonadota bacterium]
MKTGRWAPWAGFAAVALVLVGATVVSYYFSPAARQQRAQMDAVSGDSAAPPSLTRVGEAWIRPKDGAVMVAVPAGPFTMGADIGAGLGYDDAKPAHKVYLDAYWIDKNDVTVAQYRKFCEATGRQMPDAPDWGWQDDYPIVNVSWNDAKAYCDWAGAELPTEAEWEKAARGTDARKYPWGSKWDSRKLWCSADTERSGPDPVGSFPAGASPYGCLDMEGSVLQWCADWFDEDYYHDAPPRNPAGPARGYTRVLRGGTWDGFDGSFFLCAYRSDCVPAFPDYSFSGFRGAVRAGSPLHRQRASPVHYGGRERVR